MVKRNDSAVLCLEEVGLARQEAFRRFGELAGRSAAQMVEGFVRFGEATRGAAYSVAPPCRAGERPRPHAFMPDLDLRCSVTGCGLGPEEHDLW